MYRIEEPAGAPSEKLKQRAGGCRGNRVQQQWPDQSVLHLVDHPDGREGLDPRSRLPTPTIAIGIGDGRERRHASICLPLNVNLEQNPRSVSDGRRGGGGAAGASIKPQASAIFLKPATPQPPILVTRRIPRAAPAHGRWFPERPHGGAAIGQGASFGFFGGVLFGFLWEGPSS